MTGGEPAERFSGRVESYVRYRPGYPPKLLDLLRDACGLRRESVVADVGSGTGFLARLFLENGNRVFCVEPNAEMRGAAERLLGGFEGFASVAGSAEATTLPDASADFVTAGQAFHWFDAERARREFRRILRADGWVVLAWNSRKKETPFLADYERLLEEFGTDSSAVKGDRFDEAEVARFFGGPPRKRELDNRQVFDLEGLKGRVLSTSYAPERGTPELRAMMERLEAIFSRHQSGGRVVFGYDTRVYCGRLP